MGVAVKAIINIGKGGIVVMDNSGAVAVFVVVITDAIGIAADGTAFANNFIKTAVGINQAIVPWLQLKGYWLE